MKKLIILFLMLSFIGCDKEAETLDVVADANFTFDIYSNKPLNLITIETDDFYDEYKSLVATNLTAGPGGSIGYEYMNKTFEGKSGSVATIKVTPTEINATLSIYVTQNGIKYPVGSYTSPSGQTGEAVFSYTLK